MDRVSDDYEAAKRKRNRAEKELREAEESMKRSMRESMLRWKQEDAIKKKNDKFWAGMIDQHERSERLNKEAEAEAGT